MTLQIGDPAPGFKLPAKPRDFVDVQALIGKEPIVLLFFPFAFSSTCTEQMCHYRDNWQQYVSLGAKVFGISIDSPHVTNKYREVENIPFPILSDFNKEVARKYGALHEDLRGMKGVTKRAAFVIGSNGLVKYAWITDNPSVQVNFDEIKAALKADRQNTA